jgi:hypothetical protein
LVLAGSLCVNCHARQREVEKGCDSRGKPPIKLAKLLAPAVVVENAGERRSIFIGLCTGRAEAERLTERRWPGAVLVEYWHMDEAPADVKHSLSLWPKPAMQKLSPSLIDIKGQRFGRLVVREYAGDARGRCVCDCGCEPTVLGAGLRGRHALVWLPEPRNHSCEVRRYNGPQVWEARPSSLGDKVSSRVVLHPAAQYFAQSACRPAMLPLAWRGSENLVYE